MAFQIDASKCLGCGACAYVCLYKAPKAADEFSTLFAIDDTKCVSCGQCSRICPNSAIVAPDGWHKIKQVKIIPEKCKGCSLCSRVCAVGAPKGKVKEPFEIDQELCFQCGACAQKCRFEAIDVFYE